MLSNDAWVQVLTPVLKGNKVVGVLDENHSQLVLLDPPLFRLFMRFPQYLVLLALSCPFARLHAQETESTSIGGYGEVHYTNATGPNTPGEVNVKRFVLYLAHSFSERLAFRSELELEDTKIAGGEPGGEVALEQAYLDYQIIPAFTLRAGLVIVPIGIVNETHEPPTFNGVDRPDFDRDVIPTTWREIGLGAVGTLAGSSGLSYRAYLVNGLKASGFEPVSGIRGGRQEGKEASFANPSLTGRLEWARPGLRVGGSFWYGGSANQDPALGTGSFDNAVALLSADARYDVGGFMFRGVVANISVADAEAINAAYGGQVGSRVSGGYVEGAYNLLSAFAPKSVQRLNAFLRYENYDTQAKVPAGVVRDESLARRITTLGLSYKPVYNVVFKGDYQLQRTKAGLGEGEVLSLGVGYQF
jgi:hypothetical protein